MSGEVGAPSAAHPNTANDAANGAAMPAVPPGVERMRPSDLMKQRRDGTLPAHAPKPSAPAQSTRGHIAEVSRALESKMGSHVTDPEQAGTQFDVEPNQAPAPQAGKQAEQPELGDQQPDLEPASEPGQEALSALSDAEIVAKYREWESSDLAPEEIFADKLHAVKIRGQERYVDYNELRSGYMRHGDYQARGAELKQREQRIEQSEQSYKQHFEAIRDPEQFLEIYERNGYGDTIEKVAERVAERRVEHRNLVRAAGRAMAEKLGFTHQQIQAGEADNHRNVVEAMQAADTRLRQARSLEIENRKLAGERERFNEAQKQQKHQQEVQKYHQQYENQLNQLRPGSMKAHGLQDTPQNRAGFVRHLKQVIELEGLGENGITRAQTMSAARALREEKEDERAGENQIGMSAREVLARAQAEARRAALPPNRTGTGGGKPMGNPQAAAMRPSDFEKQRRAGTLGKH